MNLLSLAANLSEYKYFLALKTPEGIFTCKVDQVNDSHITVKINDEDLLKLRSFLNEVINIKERSLDENA